MGAGSRQGCLPACLASVTWQEEGIRQGGRDKKHAADGRRGVAINIKAAESSDSRGRAGIEQG